MLKFIMNGLVLIVAVCNVKSTCLPCKLPLFIRVLIVAVCNVKLKAINTNETGQGSINCSSM